MIQREQETKRERRDIEGYKQMGKESKRERQHEREREREMEKEKK